jgi:hypothetical protein
MNELAEKEIYYISYFNANTAGYNTDRGGGFKKTVYKYCLQTRTLIGEYPNLKSAASACNAIKQDISRAALGINNIFKGFL